EVLAYASTAGKSDGARPSSTRKMPRQHKAPTPVGPANEASDSVPDICTSQYGQQRCLRYCGSDVAVQLPPSRPSFGKAGDDNGRTRHDSDRRTMLPHRPSATP